MVVDHQQEHGPESVHSIDDIDQYTYGIMEEYVNTLKVAKSWDEVNVILQRWKFLIPDAIEAFENHHSKYDWNYINDKIRNTSSVKEEIVKIVEDVGEILMPSIFLVIMGPEKKYGVPWGFIFLEAIKAGAIKIVKKDGTKIAYVEG